ncbi:MAG: cytoplasmic protein, partial [Polyangiaceae bacterium]|nr:cytoplasmic protein [Polyangiaceae bacterium]
MELQASLQRELEQVGYALSQDVLDHVATWPPEALAGFRRRLLGDLRKVLGAHRELRPFYPNFPQQVMDLSEAQLYANARMHYWTLTRPQDDPAPRPELAHAPRPRLIERGTEEERDGIFTLLVRAKTAFSPQDREDVDAFVLHYRDAIAKFLPDAVPSKENLAYVGARLLEDTRVGQPFLERFVTTATDVLRLAVALAKGDVSLAEACKFPSFRRPTRRLLLGLLERAPNLVEDMSRWKSRWIRLGERLHPGEFATRFPEALRAFATLRAGTKVVSFGSEVETALAARDMPRALERLATRPGELARRLDHLMRTSQAPRSVVDRFAERAAPA